MVFGGNSCENDKFGQWASEPHFWELRSDTRPWLMARWKAHA